LVLRVCVYDLRVVFVDVEGFGIEVDEFDDFFLFLGFEPVEGVGGMILV
jgi:hypothetical protein